jgi:uncharacterized membrane protein YgdD (TMEM256/DUF423 family)
MIRKVSQQMIGVRWLVVVAAISGLLCVGIGAMGAHSLPKRLQNSGLSADEVAAKINQCEIAVRYQMYHTLAILVLALTPAIRQRKGWLIGCGLMILGMILFSGGLYSMVFLNVMGHWSIVPLGGTFLMLGWLSIAIAALFPDKSFAGTGVSGP